MHSAHSASWRALVGLVAAAGLLVSACGSDGDDLYGDGQGAGQGTGLSGTGASGGQLGLGAGGGGGAGNNGVGGNGVCNTQMTGLIRDFQQSHPDFEYVIQQDPGLVENDLGADDKPVYAHGDSGTATTHGPEEFDQWFRDTPGVNQTIPLTISLTDQGNGVYSYDNSDFFPIDDEGFGNEGNPHNYHFTYELRASFVYEGGEEFTFTGDDDLFTFVNRRLAIDLGGVHGALSDTISLDAQADELGIEIGETYELHFFFAERHLTQSNFRIDTTISFIDCGPPSPT